MPISTYIQLLPTALSASVIVNRLITIIVSVGATLNCNFGYSPPRGYVRCAHFYGSDLSLRFEWPRNWCTEVIRHDIALSRTRNQSRDCTRNDFDFSFFDNFERLDRVSIFVDGLRGVRPTRIARFVRAGPIVWRRHRLLIILLHECSIRYSRSKPKIMRFILSIHFH